VSAADATSEALEGTLVTVEGVEVVAKPNVYQVQGADGTQFEVGFDLGGNGFFISLDIGATYNLTGVMTYKFGKRQLMPMNAAGIVKTQDAPIGDDTTTIKAIQSSAESVGCAGSGSQAVNVGEPSVVSGIIATHRFTVSRNAQTGLDSIHGYYLTDGTTDEFSGVQLITFASNNTDFQPGDRVRATGRHQEHFCMTQYNASSIVKLEGSGDVPVPVVLEKTVTGEELEKYEGMLVELSDVEVLESSPARDDLRATNAGALHIDSGLGVPVPAIGANLTTLRGMLRYSFQTYRVAPRDTNDLVTAN
jgi:hypothetical protein